MSLKVKDLSYSFEHKQVLKNLNLSFNNKKIIAVLGANGSGKTTLLSLIAGLLDPDSGDIIFKDKKVQGPQHKLIPGHPGISLVKQGNSLFPLHTVKENLHYVLQSKKTSYITEKVNELGKLLDLNDQLDKIFKYLSGGEQQRVAIAAALASHPNLLLMDEPFNQTDMFLKSKLKVHLQKIVKQLELSIFFVTHDPQDALGFADEILILDKGKILEKGKSWKLYYEPKKESTAILTGYCNWLPIKDFTSYPELHRINNNYLVRPDQIIINPVDLQESFVAKVVKIYFHGLYQLFHLKMKRGNFLTASQSTNNFNIKVGQEVNISFIRKHK